MQQPSPMSAWQKALLLVLALAVTFAAASVGALFRPGPWYQGLVKPPLTPPSWIFAPVWTLLYLLMAVAAGLVSWEGLQKAVAPWAAYLVQLALNAAWSWLFFGLHQPGWALVDILALWLAIVVTIFLFRRVSPMAAGLLVPYLLWVSFAVYLNFMLWRLN